MTVSDNSLQPKSSVDMSAFTEATLDSVTAEMEQLVVRARAAARTDTKVDLLTSQMERLIFQARGTLAQTAATSEKTSSDTSSSSDGALLYTPSQGSSWNEYFGAGELEDWQRLMRDMGVEGEFPSKNQCRKALKGVWVNIYDFLDAVDCKSPVPRFPSRSALVRYTLKHRKFYPKSELEKGSPLELLMTRLYYGRREE